MFCFNVRSGSAKAHLGAQTWHMRPRGRQQGNGDIACGSKKRAEGDYGAHLMSAKRPRVLQVRVSVLVMHASAGSDAAGGTGPTEERAADVQVEKVKAWQAHRDYPIIIGSSLHAGTLATFRYEFFPLSIHSSAPYSASMAEDGTTIQRPQKPGFEGPIEFVGFTSTSQSCEFALVFHGDHFTLERIASVTGNLKYICRDNNTKSSACAVAARPTAKRRRDSPRPLVTNAEIPPTLEAMSVSRVSRGRGES